MMQENKENPNELLELLLEKCDRLYQENMLLKGKLEVRTDDEADGCKSSTTNGERLVQGYGRLVETIILPA